MWDKEFEPVVLSLFDGISCGQEALKRRGITPKAYIASEIEKYPMFITLKNFPETHMVGDVTEVFAKNLPKVDLILAGSPCQGFSFAGGQLAFDHPQSKLFFEFIRILEECRVYNPDVKFLLENVQMKKEYLKIITDHVGVEPVMINSALVSAQNRKRWYWTNIPGVGQPDDLQIDLIDVLGGNFKVKGAAKRNQVTKRGIESQLNIRKDNKSNCVVSSWPHKLNGCVEYKPITQPEDKGILLKDVLENNADSKYNLSESKIDRVLNSERGKGYFYDEDSEKIGTVIAGYHKLPTDGSYVSIPNKEKPCELKEFDKNALCHHAATATDINGHDSLKRVYADSGKAPTLNTQAGGNTFPKVLIVPQQVRVRKHEVDIERLQHLLLGALTYSKKTKQQVADELGDKFSTVEHYFRKVGSEFFAIPSEDHWMPLKEILDIKTDFFDKALTEFEVRDGKFDMADRVYNPEYKAPTIVSSNIPKVLTSDDSRIELNDNQKEKIDKINTKLDKANCVTNAIGRAGSSNEYLTAVKKKTLLLDENPPTYRRLTVTECSRLQTFYDDYLQDCYDDKGKAISNSQKYKALGNGWTVDVIAHIFKGLNSS